MKTVNITHIFFEECRYQKKKVKKTGGTWKKIWKVSKYGVISGSRFPVFGLNTGKYGPEITPYLDTLRAVNVMSINFIKTTIK